MDWQKKRVGDLKRGDRIAYTGDNGEICWGKFNRFVEAGKGLAAFVRIPGVSRQDMREVLYADDTGYERWCVCSVNDIVDVK